MEENREENKILENDSELSSINSSSNDSEANLSFASQKKVSIDDSLDKSITRIRSSLNVRSLSPPNRRPLSPPFRPLSPLQTFRPLSPASSLIIPVQNFKSEEVREINLLKLEIERLMATREQMVNHIHNIENEKNDEISYLRRALDEQHRIIYEQNNKQNLVASEAMQSPAMREDPPVGIMSRNAYQYSEPAPKPTLKGVGFMPEDDDISSNDPSGNYIDSSGNKIKKSYKKVSYREVEDEVMGDYFDDDVKYSTALDIIATYLRGQN